jgi:hypothetical protein
MPFEPEKINPEHVSKAIETISSSNIRLKPSTKFDVIINNKAYPPKEIMRYAHAAMNGEMIWPISGGKPTNDYLKKFGFQIVKKTMETDPVQAMIERYKQHIRTTHFQGESYKWQLIKRMQGRPHLNAPDFFAEIKSMEYKNLVYPMGIAVLLHIAKERAEQLRECFKKLFDENQDLTLRIKTFSDDTLKLYRELEPKLNHHQDERSMATYLTFYDPEKYMLFKTTVYEAYCDLIKVEKKKPKEKYVHYLGMLDELVSEYISEDDELLALKNQYLPQDRFEDKDHRLLAQDILYQMLDKAEREARKKEKRYWRIGTSDSEGKYWDIMKANSWASIGWADLGDLTADDLEKKDLIEMMADIGYYDGNKSTISRKAGEVFNFLKVMKPGDIVLGQDGAKVMGIGVVQDEEIGYDPHEAFPHFRPVQWKVLEPIDFMSNDGNQTTVFEVTNKDTIAKVNQLLGVELSNGKTPAANMELQDVKNFILYGPPGTGKTYNSIDKAVQITSPESYKPGNHAENKKIFDQLKQSGQIEFVTFHQSYTYEDFIVGIRPDTDQPTLRFSPYKGIFYRICKKARENYEAAKAGTKIKPYEEIVDDLLSQITDDQPLELKTMKGKPFWLTGSSETTIFLKKSTGNESHTLSISTLIEIAEGKKSIVSGLNVYYIPLIEHLNKSRAISGPREALRKYVLVIDEINRANISKVFGELITLLEEDKRLGADNELRMTLSNNESDFAVPPNLYIIGTMNTADKSIALVDIALRRRFEFIGKYPDYNVLKNRSPEAATLLESINAQVYDKKKSADFLIGHAYFLKPGSIEDTLRNKVIPLLMEYFSGKTEMVSELFKETGYAVDFDANTFSWKITKSLRNDTI